MQTHGISIKHINRLKVLGIGLTLCGIALFSYFLYSVGVNELLDNIAKFGIVGFGVILSIHAGKIVLRAFAWMLSVYEPYRLRFRDAFIAVIIGESVSSIVPLGILASGTAKAIAVRKRIPLVVGLSSVATENLFYSVTTSLFLIFGAFAFLRVSELDENIALAIDVLIVLMMAAVGFLILMVIKQWHFASESCEWLYKRGFARRLLSRGRMQVRLFENLIYGYYRRYPKRFFPICMLESGFHVLGVIEVWFILSRVIDVVPSFVTAFMFESVSRLLTIVFKLVPFLVGIDEAGARFVTETVALGAAVGLTLAIIRKGRTLFWAAVGLLIMIKRGLTLRDMHKVDETEENAS